MKLRHIIAALFLAGAAYVQDDFPPPLQVKAPPFFQFAPASGAGMGAECACTTPTGAKGEAMTFTRTGAAMCTKGTNGLRTTSIADGDLVSCASNNQPRVERDADGVLGLLVEGARTNEQIRSEEIGNATYSGSGGVALTLNGECGTSPFASPASMPEDYTFGATTTSQASGRVGTSMASCVGAACSWSIFVKGVSGTGTLDLCSYGTAVGQCTPCVYNSTTWTRCLHENKTNVGLAQSWIGNNTLWNGGTNRASNRVCVTGFQAERGAYVTSYIPTTSAAVTRNAESASFTVSPAMGADGCIASSAQWGSSSVGAVNFAAFGTAGAGNNWMLYRNTNTAAGYQIGTTVTTPAVSAMDTSVHRSVLSDVGGSRAAWWDGASVTAPAASRSGTQTVAWIGSGVAAGTPVNGIVSRYMLDPVSTRCR